MFEDNEQRQQQSARSKDDTGIGMMNRRGMLKSGMAAAAFTGFAGVGSASAIQQTRERDQQVQGTEYFVSKGGDDANEGLSPEASFLTVQRGVDQLEAGDTLTIGPGEYFEAVEREDLGGEDVNTMIRAETPGTAVLRGDVPAPEFEKVDGYRHVYAADFSQEVQAVNEVDSLEVLETAPNIIELDFNLGRFYYDFDAETLYISPSDMHPADEHDYTVSVLLERGGIFLDHPTRVIIDGLVMSGFHNKDRFPRLPNGDGDSDTSTWGIFLPGAERCVVRNATTYLNTGGIAIRSDGDIDVAGRNRIESCVAYGNRPRNGIRIYRVNGDVIRDSVAFQNGSIGIEFYLGVDGSGEQGRMEDNLSWGNVGWDFLMKTGSDQHVAERCVGPGKWKNETIDDFVRHSLLGDIRDAGRQDFQDNIILDEEDDLDLDAEFADPVNHDYRLQPASRFRGQAEDGSDLGPFQYEETIYYVSPDGNDSDDGLSPSTAWRSPARAADALDPGDTLYLESGAYDGGLQVSTDSQSGAEPIHIRSRGTGQVVIQDTVEIEQGSNIEVERVNFAESVAVDQSQDVRFTNCRFLSSDGLQTDDVDGLHLTQSEFTGFDTAAVVLRNCTNTYLSGNIFDNGDDAAVDTDSVGAIHYSDYNSYREQGSAWRIGGTLTALSDLDAGFERYATVATPQFNVDEGRVEIGNPFAFDTGGPNGNSLGLNLRQSPLNNQRELLIDGPLVHSTSVTTANIEWWSSAPAVFRVHWGETPEMEHSETLTTEDSYGPTDQLESFTTFSVNGLEPETKYYFKVEFVEFDDDESRNAMIDASEDLSFSATTAAADPQPRTLYVSPEGDDGQSGLSRSDAWRTVQHAANESRPGDTVVIGEGTYPERVRIRVTGTEENRITFKAATGEKVVLDGANESLNSAFSVYNHKDCLEFDGLYTKQYTRPTPNRLAAFTLLRSDDIRIARCFVDGRHLEGYASTMLAAADVDGLLVKNCVSLYTWNSMQISATNVCLENNVFVLPLIRMGLLVNDREDMQLRNNIFTDNLPNKSYQPIILTSNLPVLENNCFFLRGPEEERDGKVLGYGRYFGPHESLEEYNDEYGLAEDKEANFAGNPQFTSIPDSRQYFGSDMRSEFNDFGDLLATNPELLSRGIGLISEDLSDRIDLDELLFARAEPSTTAATVGQRLEFDVEDTTDHDRWIDSLSWDFGDGTTASGWWTDHRYDDPGEYIVSLTATANDGQSTTDQITVTVADLDDPIARIQPSATAVSSGDRVEFNVEDTSGQDRWINSLSWDLGDGTSATGWWTVHRYDDPGEYTVTLVATDNTGHSTADEVTISVSE